MDPSFNGISLRDAAAALLDLAMPRRCVVCRRPLTLRERFICLPCLADFPFTHFWERSHNPMADRFNARIQEDLDRISPVPPDPEPYAFAAALFLYNADSEYRHIPWHLKYEGGLAAGRFFARMLGERLAASPQFSDVDVVIPVPLHWTRRWRRGYNQAEVIAREVADVLGAELRTDILRRARRTRSQVRLPVEAKGSNVHGAFALRPQDNAPNGLPCGQTPAGFPRKRLTLRAISRRVHSKTIYPADHILLVDDTFTTGSTLNACRAMLRQAFPLPVRISVATLAFVSSD